MSEVQEIAKEAYMFLYPTIETYKVMYAQALMSDGRPGCFNTFAHNTELAGPTDTTVVSPNNDTLYSAAWLDLRNGPVMLTVPRVEKDSRYYCVLLNDGFTYNMRVISPVAGNDGWDTANYVITTLRDSNPPNLPPHKEKLIADSDFVYVLVRTQVINQDDLENVKTIQAGYKVEPIVPSGREDKITFPVPPCNPQSSEDPEHPGYPNMDIENFFTCANFMLLYMNIDNEKEQQMLENFKRISVGPGIAFNPSNDMKPDILNGALEAWIDIENDAKKVSLSPSGWSMNDPANPHFGPKEVMQGRYLDRAVGARVGLYGLNPEEAVYSQCLKDDQSAELDCGNGAQYQLNFQADMLPTVRKGGFWSITMYYLPNYLLVENEISRYSIGDRTVGVNTNEPFTIYVQATRPKSEERAKYWLPAPNGKFVLMFRLYVGTDPFNYSPPVVRKVMAASA